MKTRQRLVVYRIVTNKWFNLTVEIQTCCVLYVHTCCVLRSDGGVASRSTVEARGDVSGCDEVSSPLWARCIRYRNLMDGVISWPFSSRDSTMRKVPFLTSRDTGLVSLVRGHSLSPPLSSRTVRREAVSPRLPLIEHSRELLLLTLLVLPLFPLVHLRSLAL